MIMIGINNVQFKAFFFFLPLFVLCRYFYLFQSFEQKKMKEWVLGRVSSGRVAVWMKGNHLLSVYKCRKGTTGHCRSSIKLATWQNNPGKNCVYVINNSMYRVPIFWRFFSAMARSASARFWKLTTASPEGRPSLLRWIWMQSGVNCSRKQNTTKTINKQILNDSSNRSFPLIISQHHQLNQIKQAGNHIRKQKRLIKKWSVS